jgi:hypothetical protein
MDIMKKIFAAVVGIALLASLTSRVLAADAQTIKGEAVCTKCELGETEKCSTAIRVKDGDKTVIYYADNNDVAKDFHHSICKAPAKVTATGTVGDKDGKKTITLTKIDVDGK